MRKIHAFLPATLFVIGMAAILVACSNDSEVVAPSQRQQQPGTASPSLYDKYGGAPTVRKIVDDTVNAVLADCTQNPYFTTVLGVDGHDSVDRLKSCLDLQFTALMGGPATYPGNAPSRENPTQTYACQDMVTIHRDLGIPSDIFDQFVVDVAAVLKRNGVSDPDIATLGSALAGMKPQIVAQPGFEVTYDYTPENPAGNGCTYNPTLPTVQPSATPAPEVTALPMPQPTGVI